MLGFSVYLGQTLTADDYNYLIAMRNAGFTTVFTSLHIPEDDPEVTRNRLSELVKWCKNLDLEIIADVSEKGMKRIGVDIKDVGQVQGLGLTGLRIDDGINMAIVAKLSKSMPIALNASTITADELTSLKEHNAAFDHLQAWHNYYPRPETGLDATWLDEKNQWLQSYNLQTMAFVPGDARLRGPLNESLPTLEEQRHENPLAAVLELKKLHCDHVFIGDAGLKETTLKSFTNYIKKNIISLHIDRDLPELLDNSWHNRPDVARDVIRLREARERQLFDTQPQETALPRLIGSITCDNDEYLRYKGEIQITKRDLPADKKVNVLARVVQSDFSLLKFVGSNDEIAFFENE